MAKAGYGDLEVGAETSSPQAVHPVGSASIPGLTFSADEDTGIYWAAANQVGISTGGTGQLVIIDGVLQPVTTNDIDLGTASVQFKDAFIDGTLEADAITVGGSALATVIAGTTVTTATNAVNIGVTAVSDDDTVYPVFVTSSSGNVAAEVDTGFNFNPSSNLLTTPGAIAAVSLDISTDVDVDGTLEADAITVDGTALATYIVATSPAFSRGPAFFMG
jgi:hypothetical protein